MANNKNMHSCRKLFFIYGIKIHLIELLELNPGGIVVLGEQGSVISLAVETLGVTSPEWGSYATIRYPKLTWIHGKGSHSMTKKSQ